MESRQARILLLQSQCFDIRKCLLYNVKQKKENKRQVKIPVWYFKTHKNIHVYSSSYGYS